MENVRVCHVEKWRRVRRVRAGDWTSRAKRRVEATEEEMRRKTLKEIEVSDSERTVFASITV